MNITPCVLMAFLCFLVGCGSGASPDGGEDNQTNGGSVVTKPFPATTASPTDIPTPESFPKIIDPITVSGRVTYDFVPHKEGVISGLDYANTQARPIRSMYIDALSDNKKVIAVTISDTDGFYSIDIPKNENITIRIVSVILERFDAPSWLSTVVDNTNNNKHYVLTTLPINSVDDRSNVDIHASSGWSGQSYDRRREAAPFAILDTLYEGFAFIKRTDNTVKLPELLVKWSKNNRPVVGEIKDGNIRTSTFDASKNTIFLLGLENVDTDEYDQDVILHEFWHFLEDRLFKSHNIGGAHSEIDILDMRVAFSEGAAHAAAGMILNSPDYVDTLGSKQFFGDRLSLEKEPALGPNKGFFSRSAVHLILYDLFDNNADEGDLMSLGFTPIYNVLTSNEFIYGDALVTLYKFAEVFSKKNPEKINDFSEMLAFRGINSLNSFAEGELNIFDKTRFIPLYLDLKEQDKKFFCTSNIFGEPNKLNNYKLIKLTIDTPGKKRIILKTNDRTIKNIKASLSIFKRGELIQDFDFDLNKQESQIRYDFDEDGVYVLTYNESDKVDNVGDNGFPECVELTVKI